MNNTDATAKTVDHLFRRQAGKMVAVLSHLFGLDHLQLVEDVVQDSFIRALQTWKLHGLPNNPEAWLLQTAKHKAIDLLRKQQLHKRYTQEDWIEKIDTADTFFHEQEIADSQLRMIFACCHPALKAEDQIALTLQIVSGFSVSEIARALLSNEAVIQKRIFRAKKFLRDNQVILEIPSGKELQQRLDTVCTVLYVLFNEGYHSLKAEELIRHDLCAEAMRCCKLLTEHPLIREYSAQALLALMCLHAARFDSRMDNSNDIILLEAQDRSLWDKELIRVGFYYLNLSASGKHISAYHIEAAIASEHMIAETFSKTNWDRLLDLYDMLLQVKPSPVILLNRAVVLAQLQQTEAAIASILSIPNIDTLIRTQAIYSAVLGDLYKRLSNTVKAREYLINARSLTPSLAEKKLFQQRLDALPAQNN